MVIFLNTHIKNSPINISFRMYLRSINHTQSLDLSTSTIVFWYKVEVDKGNLNNLTQNTLDLIISTFYKVFHKAELRRNGVCEM